jgi:hypothetical protein
VTDDKREALERYVDGQADVDDRSDDMVKADEIDWGWGIESSVGKKRRERLARERDALTLQRVKERARRLSRDRG